MSKTSGRPVDIRILSRQRAQVQDEPIEQAVSGRLYQRDDKIVLAYQEPEEAGLGRTLTTLTIGPASIEMTRRGDYHARMLFSTGQRSKLRIGTPYGLIELDCLTHRACLQANDAGGVVRLDYVLEQGGQSPAIELELRYRYT